MMSDQTPHEIDVCQIVADILNVGSVGEEEDLLELGIDSITAMKFIDTLNEKLNTNLPLSILFEYPTVKSLLFYVDAESTRRLNSN